jgi:hypothetical protein
MVGSRDAGKAQRILAVRRRKNTPAGEDEILRPRVQLRRGDPGQPVFEPRRSPRGRGDMRALVREGQVRTRLPAGEGWIRTFSSGASGEADAILPVKDRPR